MSLTPTSPAESWDIEPISQEPYELLGEHLGSFVELLYERLLPEGAADELLDAAELQMMQIEFWVQGLLHAAPFPLPVEVGLRAAAYHGPERFVLPLRVPEGRLEFPSEIIEHIYDAVVHLLALSELGEGVLGRLFSCEIEVAGELRGTHL